MCSVNTPQTGNEITDVFSIIEFRLQLNNLLQRRLIFISLGPLIPESNKKNSCKKNATAIHFRALLLLVRIINSYVKH